VSAAVICRELLAPLLARLSGTTPAAPPALRAVTPGRLGSRPGQEEILRVTLGEVGGRLVATPLARGAGAITSMVRADGIVRLGPDVEVVEAGAEVEVELLRPLPAVRGTIVLAGRHDPVLAVLEDVVRARHPELALAVRSVGSRAGLAALARDEVHGAVVRLAGPGADDREAAEIGDALARLAASHAVVTVHLVRRGVGLVVASGNPLGLRGAEDLLRPGVRTPPEVERSAVRLLDPTSTVVATERRDAATRNAPDALEMTPLAVAAAVKSGLADAGLATAAAAAALGLDFVPIAEEDDALVLRGDFVATAHGSALLSALRAQELRAAVERLAGYDARRSGELAGAARP
jgi:putative molybdopterin biosynthesis protein